MVTLALGNVWVFLHVFVFFVSILYGMGWARHIICLIRTANCVTSRSLKYYQAILVVVVDVVTVGTVATRCIVFVRDFALFAR